jgi:hypothetical protein
MAFPQASRQRHFETSPRAYGPTGPMGQVAVAAVGGAGIVIDLALLTFNTPQTLETADGSALVGPGVLKSYITIEADGQDLGLIVGPSIASVSGSAFPNLLQVGSFSATGTYSGATGTCYRVFAGDSIRIIPQPGPSNGVPTGVYQGDRYLGVAAPSGMTGTVRLYQSSPTNP